MRYVYYAILSAGALHDLTGDYKLSLFVLVATFGLSSLCATLIPIKRRIQTRWCHRTKGNNARADDFQDQNIEEETKVQAAGISNISFEIEM